MTRFRQSIPAVSALYFQRTSTWLVTLFFLISGISAGVFTELSLPEEEKLRIGHHLMEHMFLTDTVPSRSALFLQSAENNLGPLLPVFFSGLTSFGCPVVYLTVLYKGIALGFSTTLLMESLGWDGVLTAILTVLPPGFLALPSLFLAACTAINCSRNRKLSNRRKKSLSFEAGPYCFCFLLPLIFTAAAIVLESFISPALLQLIKLQ